ncbi:MAG: helix-turn-helix domain-containing protein [Pseudomonadota bacterium]
MAGKNTEQETASLLEQVRKLTGQVAGGTLGLAKNTAAMTAMYGENWLRSAVLNQLEPERLEAMAEAGHFLRDARETAGLSIKDLAESLGMADKSVLEDIESGQTIMPLEVMLRSASLLARHDPIPFLIKFLRTYNPALEKTLEQWGVLALPKQYERERRFVNLYRQHDILRGFTDDEYERFVHYMESSISLVLDVMQSEKMARTGKKTTATKKAATEKTAAKPKRKPKAKAKTATKKKPAPRKRKRAPASSRRSKS